LGLLDGTGSSGASSASAYDIFTALDSQENETAAARTALGSGVDFYQKKDYARAAKEFQRAISMDPTNTDSYNFLAQTYLQQNKTGEAIKTYKISLSIDSSQDAVHRSLASIYLGKKQYSDAEKEYKASIKLNQTDTVAPYMLGQMYQQMGRNSDGELQFQKVIRMAPKDANPYYALGALYNKEGKYSDAVKQLTQAVKLKPKLVAAQFELGVAYSGLGDSAQAKRQVSLVTNLDASQGALLRATIAQPKMLSAGSGMTDNFLTALGPNTRLSPFFGFDVDTNKPKPSKLYSITFSFDSAMDPASVQDPSNWTMTKASGGAAGYYNNMLPVLPTEAYIPQNPTSVSYDPEQQTATVTFLMTLHPTGESTLDPSHVVFKFSGKDMSGKTMDPSADQYDGFASMPF
jgi:tetratricopeptide (TPR) repeat protein